jgi:hypothetical protein
MGMRGFHGGQGAIESKSASTAGTLLGQGATEYLVLLAVVLIVALVSVALLGFFPEMAGDSQRTQSEMYWKSASPVAITDWGSYMQLNGYNRIYMRLRNNAAYPIRITGIVGSDGAKATYFWGTDQCAGSAGYYLISSNFYLGPGEEREFCNAGGHFTGCPCRKEVNFVTTGSTTNYINANSVCQNSSASPGMAIVKGFGFEYIAYIEGQQITKKQIGNAPVIIKCLPAQ